MAKGYGRQSRQKSGSRIHQNEMVGQIENRSWNREKLDIWTCRKWTDFIVYRNSTNFQCRLGRGSPRSEFYPNSDEQSKGNWESVKRNVAVGR